MSTKKPPRSLGKSIIQAFKNEAYQIPQEILKQVIGQGNSRGEIRPGETINPQEQKNKKVPNQERLEEEKLLRKQEKQEVKIRIQALREEIVKISQSVQELEKEAAIAIIQETPDPGEYHLNFLENLLQFLISLREKIEEGDTWLSTFNQRSKRRNYFWGQVKKSGAKFLLSSDRTPATQMG